jgi:hypothetical protein
VFVPRKVGAEHIGEELHLVLPPHLELDFIADPTELRHTLFLLERQIERRLPT